MARKFLVLLAALLAALMVISPATAGDRGPVPTVLPGPKQFFMGLPPGGFGIIVVENDDAYTCVAPSIAGLATPSVVITADHIPVWVATGGGPQGKEGCIPPCEKAWTFVTGGGPVTFTGRYFAAPPLYANKPLAGGGVLLGQWQAQPDGSLALIQSAMVKQITVVDDPASPLGGRVEFPPVTDRSRCQ